MNYYDRCTEAGLAHVAIDLSCISSAPIMNVNHDSFLTSALRLAKSQGKGKKPKLRFSSFAGEKWIMLVPPHVLQKAVKWWKKGKKMAQRHRNRQNTHGWAGFGE